MTELDYKVVLTEVKTYKVEVFCPNDNEPLMFQGMILTSFPPQYPHKCKECGYSINLQQQYPRIEHR